MSVGARQLSVGINLCEIIGQAALMSPAPLQLQLAGPRVGLLLGFLLVKTLILV